MSFRDWLKENVFNWVKGVDSPEWHPNKIEIKPLQKIYNAASKSGKLTIYRTLFVPSEDAIEWHNLGTHWSWRPIPFTDMGGSWKPLGTKAIANYGNDPRNKPVKFVIKGEVLPKNIDWDFTAANYLQWPWQAEATLKINVPIKILALNSKSVNELGNSGTGIDNPEYRKYRSEYIRDIHKDTPEPESRWD